MCATLLTQELRLYRVFPNCKCGQTISCSRATCEKSCPKLYQTFDKGRTLSKSWRKNQLSVGAWITFIKRIWEKALRVLLQFLNLHTICTGPEWMRASRELEAAMAPLCHRFRCFHKSTFNQTSALFTNVKIIKESDQYNINS